MDHLVDAQADGKELFRSRMLLLPSSNIILVPVIRFSFGTTLWWEKNHQQPSFLIFINVQETLRLRLELHGEKLQHSRMGAQYLEEICQTLRRCIFVPPRHPQPYNHCKIRAGLSSLDPLKGWSIFSVLFNLHAFSKIIQHMGFPVEDQGFVESLSLCLVSSSWKYPHNGQPPSKEEN